MVINIYKSNKFLQNRIINQQEEEIHTMVGDASGELWKERMKKGLGLMEKKVLQIWETIKLSLKKMWGKLRFLRGEIKVEKSPFSHLCG